MVPDQCQSTLGALAHAGGRQTAQGQAQASKGGGGGRASDDTTQMLLLGMHVSLRFVCHCARGCKNRNTAYAAAGCAPCLEAQVLLLL